MKPVHIVVAGAGGNTGSHLLPHLARMSGIARITLVDPDVYEPANLAVQNIDSRDIGQPKVAAQAKKLQLIHSHLEINALQERIEDVPRGLLRGGLIVSCLDSRVARQHVNEIAWRLKTPWIDCGILGSQNLARVNYYAAAHDAPCLECAWGPDEYALIEQEYLCGAGSGSAYPSMASSALGALAASLMALEIAKLISSELTEPATARQVLIDAQHHNLRISTSRRNPWCRFDHRHWAIKPWCCQPESTTVGAALKALGSLRVEGHRFVQEMLCPDCGHKEKALRLNRPPSRCSVCNRRMVTAGFGSLERLDAEFAKEYSDFTLAQIGLRAGDIVSCGKWHHRELEAA
jgi:molybdopterin/thiamine biosynthesis adenylyltransferase